MQEFTKKCPRCGEITVKRQSDAIYICHNPKCVWAGWIWK